MQGFRVWVWVLGTKGLGFRDLGFRVQGCRVWGLAWEACIKKCGSRRCFVEL